MNTYIPADKLIAEIERLLARANRRTDKEQLSHNSEMEKFGEDYWNGYGDLAYSLLGFITSLQQEQPTRGYDEAYLNECIAKARKTWKGVDVDKYMDEMRGREQEQPEQPRTCKTCSLFENDCPFVRGKFIPYPSKGCKDYTAEEVQP